MYVEGFVSLKGADTTKVTIGLPYLAFYGDWTDAPLFDYSTYELAESQKDTNVPAEDKLVASAADTKVIGMYFDDKYILQLGAYLYEMDESEVKIYPERKKPPFLCSTTEDKEPSTKCTWFMRDFFAARHI